MGSVRTRGGADLLFIDFRFRGVRCREKSNLRDTPANRRQMQKLLDRIEAEITLGTFNYGVYFPKSKRASQFAERDQRVAIAASTVPSFRESTEAWFAEAEHEWRNSHRINIRQTLDYHVLPEFSDLPVNQIAKSEILTFRSKLTKADTNKGRKQGLSASRINHVMAPLRMILIDAAEKHGFTNPWKNINPLKVPKSDVDPFDLSEVQQILTHVRGDFKNYYTVRFLTGMRPAEIDGLMWKYIDFKRRQILIREAIVGGQMVYVKTDGSFREIDMSQVVYDALQAHKAITGKQTYVFCNSVSNPLVHNEVTKHVWHPLLRFLGLKKRRPYQSRHTAATLWLAAGESPEWIARQMGHTTTEMLFTVYSRFVPNLTRQDGSAFEKILQEQLINNLKPETTKET